MARKFKKCPFCKNLMYQRKFAARRPRKGFDRLWVHTKIINERPCQKIRVQELKVMIRGKR